MSKATQSNTRANQIFEDLEKYLSFCKDYGYIFDEADLYNNKSIGYKQYTKHLSGKEAKDNWEDAIK